MQLTNVLCIDGLANVDWYVGAKQTIVDTASLPRPCRQTADSERQQNSHYIVH